MGSSFSNRSKGRAHSVPGATFDNKSRFGPIENGKKITIMKKNAKLKPKPPPARTAILKSRRIKVIKETPHLNCLTPQNAADIVRDQ